MTMAEEPICDAFPPDTITDEKGRVWTPGDCWCTLPPGHDGDCHCGPCAKRGAPGWPHPTDCGCHKEATA